MGDPLCLGRPRGPAHAFWNRSFAYSYCRERRTYGSRRRRRVAARLPLWHASTRIQEPVILLTAVHFYFTGFATAILAGTLSAFAQRRNQWSQFLRSVIVLVIFVPFLTAAGFVFSPTLKVAAVFVLSISVAALAAFRLSFAAVLHNSSARGFLRASSASVIAGMAQAGVYVLGDYLYRDWLLIPPMASTHGVLNGLGFVMLGLLGWLVESSDVGGIKCASQFASHQSHLGSLPDTSEVSRTVGN